MVGVSKLKGKFGQTDIFLKRAAALTFHFSLVHNLACLAFSVQRAIVFLATVAWRDGASGVAQSLVVAADDVRHIRHAAIAYFKSASVEDLS